MKNRLNRGIQLLVSMAMCFLMIYLMGQITVYASPACNDPYTFTQPDGTTVTLTTFGDEFLNWTEDSNGNLVEISNEGMYYAMWTDDGPVATSVLASDSPTTALFRIGAGSKGHDIPEAVLEKAYRAREEAMPEDVYKSSSMPASAFSPRTSLVAAQEQNTPGVTADVGRKLLVISVTFPNDSRLSDMPPVSNDEIEKLVFGEGNKSVNDYYMEMFDTDYDVVEPIYGSGVFTYPYSGNHPYNGTTTNNTFTLAQCQAAIDYVTDPTRNPGLAQAIVDLGIDADSTLPREDLSIVFIYQGYERSLNASSVDATKKPHVWAYAWYNRSLSVTLEGKTVKTTGYSLTGMFHRVSSTRYPLAIGMICHELGHSGYRFMDTYDTESYFKDSKSYGHGYWSLMSSGNFGYLSSERICTSPGYIDAYNLVSRNIVTPEEITWDELASITISNHLEIYKITTKNPNQYFLLQQRKEEGFDAGIFYRLGTNASTAQGGLIIYHIDESVTTENNKNTHYLVTIEEAHGGTQHFAQLQTAGTGNSGDRADLFGNGKNDFSMSTSPSSGLYSAFSATTTAPTQTADSGVIIKNILYANGQTTFTVSGEPSETYSITAGTMANGKVTANKATAAAGETVTLAVTPNSGYKLKDGSLKYNGTAVSGSTFTMPAANVTITAEFEQIVEQIVYNVTIGTMANGKVTANKATAAAGETVTLTVTPNSGYKLKDGSLKYNGTAVTGSTFTMPAANVTIAAEFETVSDTNDPEAWNSTKIYNAGDIVTYNGSTYKAKYWTKGDVPGTSAAWELVSGPIPEYSSTMAYNAGDKCIYNGVVYKAKWWTKGDIPDKGGPWEVVQ